MTNINQQVADLEASEEAARNSGAADILQGTAPVLLEELTDEELEILVTMEVLRSSAC